MLRLAAGGQYEPHLRTRFSILSLLTPRARTADQRRAADRGDGCLSAGAFRKLALPCQRVSDDGLQIVKARLPSECGTDSVAGGHDLCRVARPPRCKLDLQVDARDTLDGVNHVQHRKATAVTAIERRGSAAVAQIGERITMRGNEIGHMNVIPDAGAVRRRVVGAKDTERWSQPERGFDRDLYQVGGPIGRLPGAPERV